MSCGIHCRFSPALKAWGRSLEIAPRLSDSSEWRLAPVALRDARLDFPSGIYRFNMIPISISNAGDIFARGFVRHLEIERSGQFLLEQVRCLPAGPIRLPVGPRMPDAVAVSMVEGWRGEICHVAVTDARGQFERYKIVDPSFHNWVGLQMAPARPGNLGLPALQ